MKDKEFYYIYSFIYDKKKLNKSKLQPINFKDDFLVTFDKIFRDIDFETTENIPAKLNILNKNDQLLKDKKIFISDNKKIFEIVIENVDIYFLTNETAFFVMKVLPVENLSLAELYYLNFLLSSFYKFEDKDEIYIAISDKNLTLDDFKSFKAINYFLYNQSDNIKKCLEKFPFNNSKNKSDFDESRIGLLKNEEKEIKECLEKNPEILHYKSINEIINKITNKILKVHYDTFLTGFFIDYVKTNKSFNYYDNFNPLGGNFLFLYANFFLSKEELKKEYEEKFVNYEPFLSNLPYKGFIKNIPYKIIQPVSDMVTIGNQNNIINFINKDSNCIDEIVGINCNTTQNKELIIFLYVLFQNIYLLMLTSMFVVDYNKEKRLLTILKRYIGNVNYIKNAIHKYHFFIVNHNFNSISDNPKFNNLYQFIRNLKEIPIKLSDLKLIVGQYGSFKNIIQNISQNFIIFLFAMFIFMFVLKLLSIGADFFIDKGVESLQRIFNLIFG